MSVHALQNAVAAALHGQMEKIAKAGVFHPYEKIFGYYITFKRTESFPYRHNRQHIYKMRQVCSDIQPVRRNIDACNDNFPRFWEYILSLRDNAFQRSAATAAA